MKTTPPLIRALALSLAMTLALPPGLAFAGAEQALEYYNQAKQAYKGGDFQKAADLLEMAYAEDPDLIYQYNRIRALQAMGKYEQALKVLRIYKGPMKRDEDSRFEDIAQIEQQLTESSANQPGEDANPPDENHDEKDKNTDTKPDENVKNTDTTPDKISGKTSSDGSTGALDGGTGAIVGWTLIGVGGAALATGGLFSTGLLLPSEPSQDAIDRQKVIAISGLGAGVAVAGTGLIVLLVSKSRAKKSDGVSNLIITPVASPNFTGAGMLWRF